MSWVNEMIYKCSNDRRLLITTKENLEFALNASGLIPCVVLLTAWQSENASISFWQSVVQYLLEKGSSYFVCVGTYSESLHDAIDEFYYLYNEERGLEGTDLVTTYHYNESTEDVIAYFVHGTELRCKPNGGLVAILGDTPKDQEILNFIKKRECEPLERS